MAADRTHWGAWEALADVYPTWAEAAEAGLTWHEVGFVPTAVMEGD